MKKAKKELNPAGNHHPYCITTYRIAVLKHENWSCCCDIIKDYDKWLSKQCHSWNKLKEKF